MHQGGDVEKFFIAGGFAVTHANSVTDLSVTEAFPLGDFDEASVKVPTYVPSYFTCLHALFADVLYLPSCAVCSIDCSVYNPLYQNFQPCHLCIIHHTNTHTATTTTLPHQTNYAEAVKNSTQGDEAAQAAAKIEAATMQALGRAMGVTL